MSDDTFCDLQVLRKAIEATPSLDEIRELIQRGIRPTDWQEFDDDEPFF